MAKKKAGQAPKIKPEISQMWLDRALNPPVKVHIDGITEDDQGNKTYDCSLLTPGPDGQSSIPCQKTLLDFAVGTMELLDGPGDDLGSDPGIIPPDEQTDDEGPKPQVLIIPGKKGSILKCPSPNCGDEHPMENACTKSEWNAEVAKFETRHAPHFSDGLLFGGGK